jgi:hypothetical protein
MDPCPDEMPGPTRFNKAGTRFRPTRNPKYNAPLTANRRPFARMARPVWNVQLVDGGVAPARARTARRGAVGSSLVSVRKRQANPEDGTEPVLKSIA